MRKVRARARRYTAVVQEALETGSSCSATATRGWYAIDQMGKVEFTGCRKMSHYMQSKEAVF